MAIRSQMGTLGTSTAVIPFGIMLKPICIAVSKKSCFNNACKWNVYFLILNKNTSFSALKSNKSPICYSFSLHFVWYSLSQCRCWETRHLTLGIAFPESRPFPNPKIPGRAGITAVISRDCGNPRISNPGIPALFSIPKSRDWKTGPGLQSLLNAIQSRISFTKFAVQLLAGLEKMTDTVIA